MGSDKNLWFTEFGSNIVGRITITGAVAQRFLPFSISPAGADEIAAGPDGNLWVTLSDQIHAHSKIARISTHFSEAIFALPGHSVANGITAGPDGALWVEDRLGAIERLSITGTVTTFSTGAGTQPYKITRGPDSNLWFTDFNGRIGRITPAGFG